MYKKRIKLLCNWITSENLTNEWKKMIKEENKVTLTTTKNDSEIDYYIIINGTNEFFIPSKSIYFQMEPNMTINTKQWGMWSNPSSYMKCYLHEIHPNLTEWHLSKNVYELLKDSPTKTKNMSIILSSKYNDEGQKLRIDFYNYMKNKDIKIDCYGKNMFKENICVLPDYKKDNGLMEYKYTFNAENHSIENYYTEKITDAILSETLCFYWGNKSIFKYIDPQSFIFLELKDFEKDYLIVKNAIDNNEWEKKLPYIRKEKERILKNNTMFDQIEKLLMQ